MPAGAEGSGTTAARPPRVLARAGDSEDGRGAGAWSAEGVGGGGAAAALPRRSRARSGGQEGVPRRGLRGRGWPSGGPPHAQPQQQTPRSEQRRRGRPRAGRALRQRWRCGPPEPAAGLCTTQTWAAGALRRRRRGRLGGRRPGHQGPGGREGVCDGTRVGQRGRRHSARPRCVGLAHKVSGDRAARRRRRRSRRRSRGGWMRAAKDGKSERRAPEARGAGTPLPGSGSRSAPRPGGRLAGPQGLRGRALLSPRRTTPGA